MKTPVCIGMMRSASRMTWQVVSMLEEADTRPKEWLQPGWPEDIGTEVWPHRDHKYISGPPAIFTYRHPIESFLSLQAKFKIDVGNSWVDRGQYTVKDAWIAAMTNTGLAWETYRQLKKDSEDGRPVLFLRYEDYYDNPINRITDIIDFWGIEASDEKIAKILEETSVKSNFAKGKAMSHFHPEKPFQAISGADSGMQRDHVSEQTFGVPGKWLEIQSKFVKEVQAGTQPALQALKEMTLDMGYEI